MTQKPTYNGRPAGLNFCACGCGQPLVVKFPGEYAVGHSPRRDRYYLATVLAAAATSLILATCYGISNTKEKIKTWVAEQCLKNP